MSDGTKPDPTPPQLPAAFWDFAITLAGSEHIQKAIAKHLEPAPRFDPVQLIPLLPMVAQLLRVYPAVTAPAPVPPARTRKKRTR